MIEIIEHNLIKGSFSVYTINISVYFSSTKIMMVYNPEDLKEYAFHKHNEIYYCIVFYNKKKFYTENKMSGSMRHKFGLDRTHTMDMDHGLRDDIMKNKYTPYVLMILVIFIVNLPQVYAFTNNLATKLRLDGWILDEKGLPTGFGVAVHAIVAVLLILLLKRYVLKKSK